MYIRKAKFRRARKTDIEPKWITTTFDGWSTSPRASVVGQAHPTNTLQARPNGADHLTTRACVVASRHILTSARSGTCRDGPRAIGVRSELYVTVGDGAGDVVMADSLRFPAFFIR